MQILGLKLNIYGQVQLCAIEVVGRGSETQLQVRKKLNILI